MDDNDKTRNRLMLINQQGGMYCAGRPYNIETKMRIAFCILSMERRGDQLNIAEVARRTGVSSWMAHKVKMELDTYGQVLDDNNKKRKFKIVCGMLRTEHELFLLALRAEKPSRTNHDYCIQLFNTFGVVISKSSISNFFLRRFDHAGKYKKARLIPLDKFKITNQTRYFEFMAKVNTLTDRTRWLFFDEKHLQNMDVIHGKVRANPLTGYVDAIGVSGDFRESYTLMAGITINPYKGNSMVYQIDKEHGTASLFMEFIRSIIISGWLMRGDILCLDNARIHSGGDAEYVENLLWNYILDDGQPLHVLIVWLPTQSPELNPIELIFHILARRIQRLRTNIGAGPCDKEVVRYAQMVMDTMSFEIIAKCYIHCGY